MNTQESIDLVMSVAQQYGQTSIIALAGVPGTGKTHIARIAADKLAGDSLRVKEVQFHPSFSYEEFVEGLTFNNNGGVSIKAGVFLEHNRAALSDPDHTYVLLIEEFTRANVASVLGELLTYVEHRERPVAPLYSRMPTRIAQNLQIIATYNPVDRSAIDIDAALLRRLRIVSFPPSMEQLEEMLTGKIEPDVISKIKGVFSACETTYGTDYELGMPFGHGIFSEVSKEDPDLVDLWQGRINHILRRPHFEPHPFTEVIEKAYPWKRQSSSRPST